MVANRSLLLKQRKSKLQTDMMQKKSVKSVEFHSVAINWLGKSNDEIPYSVQKRS